MKNAADIVIIGAGIIGPSTAYHLAKFGVKNITILDSFYVGGLATNATAAMIMQQTGVEETTQLAKLSVEKYKNFKDEVGEDIEFNNCGSIVYTSKKESQEILKNNANIQNKNGVLTDVLQGSEIEEKSKGLLNGDGLLLGNYVESDAYINAHLAVQAYLNSVKSKGLVVRENTKVNKIILVGNKVNAVELENGEKIYTDTVINCAGIYASDIAKTIGINLPIKASKKCLGVIKNVQYKDFPIVEDYDDGWYFRPYRDGILVGFGVGEWTEDSKREKFPKFEIQKIKELKKYLMLRVPSLLPAEFISGWAGYRPMIDPKCKDALPIIGPVEEIKGYFNNCGYGEFGITLAPIGGELIAQIVLNKPTRADVKPFLLSRFSKF
ncbi:MAG TPA: FAD-dependent oxidoreductase [Candidatus Saccharimonadales bacterium]|nr:FAD-dependent oxidoreductase [Candidatus Saccharimonadales bacterium]